jgi:hypothetical protein
LSVSAYLVAATGKSGPSGAAGFMVAGVLTDGVRAITRSFFE